MRIKINKLNSAAALATLLVLATFPFFNPCETEDARVCTWDASSQGNGTGTNFIDYYGLTVYLP